MNDVTAALAEYRNNNITELQMMRRLLSYPAWYVPCDGKDDSEYGVPPFDITKVIAIPNEASPDVLPLFSNGDAFDAFRNATASPDEVAGVCMAGYEFFAGGLEGVDAVVLNPGTPEELRIPADNLGAVSELADAIEVEQAWARLHQGTEKEGDNRLVARYPNYHFAMVERDGKAGVRMVSNNHAWYIPIFTHPDALALAEAELREGVPPEEFRTSRAGGKTAFPLLAKEQADGIVINYLGPSEPVSFRLSITELMLEELAKG